MGTYIRNVGITQLIGGIIIPAISILLIFIKLGMFSLDIAVGLTIIGGIIILASIVFLILMIVRGFLLSSASGNNKYKHFSILMIVSYGVSILFAYLFDFFTKTAIANAVTSISTSMLSSSVNYSRPTSLIVSTFDATRIIFHSVGLVFLIPPIIMTVVSSIILIFAWLQLKSAVMESSDDIQVHKVSNSVNIMIIAIILLGIFGILGSISIYLLFISTIVIAVFFIGVFVFVILQISAYIVIGQKITHYMRRYE